MTGATLDVIIDDPRWAEALGDADALCDECRRAVASAEPRLAGAATLLFADDEALRELNRRFRGIDKPTNVLSFPSAAGDSVLGDIAIAYETVRRESAEAGVAFRDHAAHLIVHGLLHLAGHDHEKDDEAERMEALETGILASIGVADPYASPTSD